MASAEPKRILLMRVKNTDFEHYKTLGEDLERYLLSDDVYEEIFQNLDSFRICLEYFISNMDDIIDKLRMNLLSDEEKPKGWLM